VELNRLPQGLNKEKLSGIKEEVSGKKAPCKARSCETTCKARRKANR
jgi:hypothetical protein